MKARTTLAWGLSATALLACGTSVEDDGSGGSGGGSQSSTSVEAGPSTSGSTSDTTSVGTGGAGGGEGGSAPCSPEDVVCFCDACEAEGGVCGDYCNWTMGQSATCFSGEPPGEGEFSCDGLLNCDVGDVCVASQNTGGDGCDEHACLPPAAECRGDELTCECLLLQHPSGTCEVLDGNVHFRVEDGIEDPFWVLPGTCGDIFCEEGELCISCDSIDECWPSEAPPGEFVCGPTICSETEFCEAAYEDPSACPAVRCGALSDCKSSNPCDCAIDPCEGSGAPFLSCEVYEDGNAYVTCSP